MKDHDQFCTEIEKEQMVDELRKCEYCSTSIEEHDDCRHEVAKEAGERLSGCVTE